MIWGYRQGPVESMPQKPWVVGMCQVSPAKRPWMVRQQKGIVDCKSCFSLQKSNFRCEKIVQLQVVRSQGRISWIISFQLRTLPIFHRLRRFLRSYSSECEVLPGARHGYGFSGGIFQGLMLSVLLWLNMGHWSVKHGDLKWSKQQQRWHDGIFFIRYPLVYSPRACELRHITIQFGMDFIEAVGQ